MRIVKGLTVKSYFPPNWASGGLPGSTNGGSDLGDCYGFIKLARGWLSRSTGRQGENRLLPDTPWTIWSVYSDFAGYCLAGSGGLICQSFKSLLPGGVPGDHAAVICVPPEQNGGNESNE